MNMLGTILASGIDRRSFQYFQFGCPCRSALYKESTVSCFRAWRLDRHTWKSQKRRKKNEHARGITNMVASHVVTTKQGSMTQASKNVCYVVATFIVFPLSVCVANKRPIIKPLLPLTK